LYDLVKDTEIAGVGHDYLWFGAPHAETRIELLWSYKYGKVGVALIKRESGVLHDDVHEPRQYFDEHDLDGIMAHVQYCCVLCGIHDAFVLK